MQEETINLSLNLHLILLQRINEGLPLHWVKSLIDIDLIPNLFRGILIVVLLITGHSLKMEKGHLRSTGQAKVQILALPDMDKQLPVHEVQIPHFKNHGICGERRYKCREKRQEMPGASTAAHVPSTGK